MRQKATAAAAPAIRTDSHWFVEMVVTIPASGPVNTGPADETDRQIDPGAEQALADLGGIAPQDC
jgi:hypothetical protein